MLLQLVFSNISTAGFLHTASDCNRSWKNYQQASAYENPLAFYLGIRIFKRSCSLFIKYEFAKKLALMKSFIMTLQRKGAKHDLFMSFWR